MICRGVCACTKMVWMCVLYVSFGCVALGCIYFLAALVLVCVNVMSSS